MTDFDAILRDPISRRAFLARMTAAGLGSAAMLLLAGCGGHDDSSSSSGGGGTGGGTTFFDPTNFPGIPGTSENVVVLNYALTLEILEADLYRQLINIASGRPADTKAPTNNDYSGYTLQASTAGLDPTLAAVGFLYLQQYAPVEAAHRDFLQGVLGSAAVKPNAKGYTTGLASTATLKEILSLLRVVEETGVTAYLGAAGFLTDFGTIQVASTIYSTEARHSAGINYVLQLDAGPSGVAGGTQPAAGLAKNDLEYANTPKAVLNTVKQFIL